MGEWATFTLNLYSFFFKDGFYDGGVDIAVDKIVVINTHCKRIPYYEQSRNGNFEFLFILHLKQMRSFFSGPSGDCLFWVHKCMTNHAGV